MKHTALIAVAGLVVTLLAVPGPAAAAPTWVDVDDVLDAGDQVTQLHAGPHLDPKTSAWGGSLAWVDAATDEIVLSYRTAGGAWSDATVVASPAATPLLEEVRGTSAYYSEGSSLHIANLDPATGEPDDPSTVTDSYVPGTSARLGDLLSWAEDVGGGQQRLVVANSGNRQVVERPRPVSYRENTGGLVHEHGYVAWVEESAGGGQRLLVKGWGSAPAVPLGRAGSTYADLDFSDTGSLAWTETSPGGAARVRVAVVDTDDSTWTTADVPTGPGAADPSTSRLANGGRLLVWREQEGGSWSVRSSTAPARGTAWSPAVTLESGTGVLGAEQFAAASSMGGQLATWCRPEAAGCTMRAAFRAGRTWRAATTLGTVADAGDAQLARYAQSELGVADYSPPTAWTDGSDDVRVSAVDYLGPVSTTRRAWRATLDNRLKAAWSAVDDWSGVASYRIETRSTRARAPRDPAWHTSVPTTTATSRTLQVAPGTTRCYRLTATDTVGNTAAGAADRCTTAPLDDRAFTRSKGWTTVRDPQSYQHTLLRADRRGATLRLTNVPYDRVVLMVRRLPRGGKVEVLLDNHRRRVLDTAGDVRRLFALAAPARYTRSLPYRLRTLRIRVVSQGRPVLVDGVFVGSHVPNPSDVNHLTRP